MRSAALLVLVGLFGGCAGTEDRVDAANRAVVEQYGHDAPTVVGLYAETDAGAIFMDCATTKEFEVVRAGDSDALHRAVRALPRPVDTPVIVSLIGGGENDGFYVERFLAVWPEETCEKAGVRTTLHNTYWKLVELNGTPVTPHEHQREMHIILRTQSNQIGGFGGCNTLGGRYEVDGDRLRFVGLTSTEMACNYLDEERAFIDALTRTTNYRSVGESLQLRDDTGPIARLRAVYLR